MIKSIRTSRLTEPKVAGMGSTNSLCWWFILSVNLMLLVKYYFGCVCENVFEESNILTDRLSKADCSPECGWPSSNRLKAWMVQKGWLFLKKEGTPPAWLLSWDISLSCLWVSRLPAFGLEVTALTLLSLWIADCRSWDFSAPIIVWDNAL